MREGVIGSDNQDKATVGYVGGKGKVDASILAGGR